MTHGVADNGSTTQCFCNEKVGEWSFGNSKPTIAELGKRAAKLNQRKILCEFSADLFAF